MPQLPAEVVIVTEDGTPTSGAGYTSKPNKHEQGGAMHRGMSNGWRGFRRWAQRCIRWMRILKPQPRRTWRDDMVYQYSSQSPRVWQGGSVRTIVTSDGEHATIGTLNASRITTDRISRTDEEIMRDELQKIRRELRQRGWKTFR